MIEKRRFDTEVKYVKYKVLKEVARRKWNGTLLETILDIPKKIVSGNIPSARCCVYKERAIVEERVKMAMGGDKTNPNVIEVIGIACDPLYRPARGISHRRYIARHKRISQIPLGIYIAAARPPFISPRKAHVNAPMVQFMAKAN